ncbi:MAG TPA: TonB-dependent receptor [Longimicrobiales bacterium]|nr:TonB-dependent receptor [Longimicrobiales bacterium]
MSVAAALLVALVQTSGAVSGTVRADSTEAPIGYASVEIVELDRGVSADEQGNYLLSEVPLGSWTLRASALGYTPEDAPIEIGPSSGTLTVSFLLQPAPIPLGQINVEATRVLQFTGPPPARVTMETLRQVPALAEVDVLRAVTVLPSVIPVSEYSSALYVRGATPDQTEILIDGFPVHNPYHLGGVYGAFNPDAVEAVEVWPGAMPASVGSRISSVVSIETRDGGTDRTRSSGSLGLTSARLEVDGPVPFLPGTYLVAGRKSYRNFTGGGIAADGIIPRNMEAGFHDVLAKWRLPWGRGHSVEGLFFTSGEGVGVPEDGLSGVRYDWEWGSRLFGLRSQLLLGDRLSLDASVARSTFDTELGSWWDDYPLPDRQTVDANGAMADHLAEAQLTWQAARYALRVGGQYRTASMDYDAERDVAPPPGLWDHFVPTFAGDYDQASMQSWAEADVRILPRVALRVGVRNTELEGLGSTLQPRAGLQVGLMGGLTLTAGAGRYVQGVHSIRVEEAAGTSFMAYDLLRSASEAIGPPTAEDVVVGLEYRRQPASVRVDVFAKRYTGLALPPLPINPWSSAVIEPDDFAEATGTTRGVEVLADYVTESASLWLSYALRDGSRTVNGFTFTPRFERRHNLDAMGSIALPDGLTLNLRTVYASGQPLTPVSGQLRLIAFAPERDLLTEERTRRRSVLGEHNSSRMPDYFRVDVGGALDFTREMLDYEVDLTFRVQIINVLNRVNVLYWNPTTNIGFEDDATQQFPISLTAAVEWAF